MLLLFIESWRLAVIVAAAALLIVRMVMRMRRAVERRKPQGRV